MQQSDEILLALYLQGDQNAFSLIVERYQQSLFLYLYKLICHRQMAEDLLQETFLRVVKHLWRFSPEKSFRTWIFTIATNLARNELRKHKRKLSKQDFEQFFMISDTYQDPLDKIIQEEESQKLLALISKLEEPQKMVFILRLYHELPYGEIAEIVGCKPATARTRMFCALEKLRQLWEKEK